MKTEEQIVTEKEEMEEQQRLAEENEDKSKYERCEVYIEALNWVLSK